MAATGFRPPAPPTPRTVATPSPSNICRTEKNREQKEEQPHKSGKKGLELRKNGSRRALVLLQREDLVKGRQQQRSATVPRTATDAGQLDPELVQRSLPCLQPDGPAQSRRNRCRAASLRSGPRTWDSNQRPDPPSPHIRPPSPVAAAPAKAAPAFARRWRRCCRRAIARSRAVTRRCNRLSLRSKKMG